MNSAKLQFWAWCFLFVLWVAGCTVEFKSMGDTAAPSTPNTTLVPCVTVTAVLTTTASANAISPITGTLPLTGTPAATITATVSTPARPITATVTTAPANPITATRTVTATVAPTSTLRPTRPITATVTPGVPVTATRVTTATVQPTPSTGTRTPAPLPSPTATKAPGSAPQLPTPTLAATNTPFPISTATPTRPVVTATVTATATRPPTTPTPGTPVATPTSGTPATPPPANAVYVRSHSSFLRDGTLFVVGEVVNGTAGAVYRVRVTATFFNSNDQILATEEGLAYLAQTSPDQRNPFKLHLENAPSDITRYELSLSWDDVSVISYQDFTVISQELRQSDGPLIAGELRNDFNENLGSAVVVISLYDAGGNVVDVYQSTPRATQLAPSEVSPYEVPVSAEPPFTTFLVQAQGKRAIFF